jgi:predicted CoA-binding protein
MVSARLKHFSKTVHHVNPRSPECHPTLAMAHAVTPIEAVNLIISPKIGVSIVDEMIELNIKNLFVQPGAGTPEIIDKAKAAGVEVVEGCVLIAPDREFSEGGKAKL